MSRLVFKADDLRRLVTHALAAPSHSVGYGGVKGDVVLAHDQGVYLMSAGQPRDLVSDPRTDSAWWETARDLVGGDDFGQHLPWATGIRAAIDGGARTVVIDITEESISLVTLGSKCRPGERVS